MKNKKILFILSGSIACYKACEVLSALVKGGADVQVCATKNALKFVGEATLEGLSHKKVLSEMFESGSYLKHIELNGWADLTLLCPATANIINKTAAGIADDFASSLLAANGCDKSFLIVPAMNVNLYKNPATQENIEKLKKRGAVFIGPQTGYLACGVAAEGKMSEPEEIINEIKKFL